MTTGDVVYSLRFSLTKILPELGFDLGSTAGESSVLSARLQMLCDQSIDQHILKQQEKINNQVGFTRGSQIEDNLYTLQYCIDQSSKKMMLPIVTCLDYKKAFDSTKRGKIIEALMYYRIHYKIVH